MPETIIEILIDYSGSMGYMKGQGPEEENKYLIDGKTRLFLLKRVLIEQVLPTIYFANKIFIRKFRMNTKEEGGKSKDIFYSSLIYQGNFDLVKITAIISGMQDPPPGGTPITAAIKEAFENLSKYPQSDRKMILLTDGEENCGGNYIETVKNIEKTKGIPCKIFIIGINQDEKSEVQSKTIATGGYYNIKSQAFINYDIQRVLQPLKVAVLKNTLENINIAEERQSPEIKTQNSALKNKIEEKIVELSKESTDLKLSKIDEIEIQIQEYLNTGQRLLSDLASLKEILRINILLASGIESTTLTIDTEYSDSIRIKSESYLYKLLCDKHGPDKVKWINQQEEGFEPYDFVILDENSNIINYIECKGTSENKPTFYLSSNEWSFFLSNIKNYQVYRIFNIEKEPTAFSIDNLYEFLMNGRVVPYLLKPEVVKECRVFLTLLSI